MEECDLRSKTDKHANITDACHVEIKEAKPAKSLKEWLKVPGLYKVLTPEITSFTDQITLLCNYTPYDIWQYWDHRSSTVSANSVIGEFAETNKLLNQYLGPRGFRSHRRDETRETRKKKREKNLWLRTMRVSLSCYDRCHENRLTSNQYQRTVS